MCRDNFFYGEWPKCCRFLPSNSTFSGLRQSANSPFSSANSPFSDLRQSANSPFLLLAFLLVLSLRAPNPKIIGTMPWPTPTLLCHSNKNKQYLATNTMRRPSHCHCWSDNTGNRVNNCTFIAVIEWIQRPFLFSSHDATTPLRRWRWLMSPQSLQLIYRRNRHH